MTYLSEEELPSPEKPYDNNSLEPPIDLMTRKQKYKQYLKKITGEVQFQKLDFKKEEPVNKITQKKEAPVKVKKKGSLYFQRFSSLKEEDWDEVFQAGCKLWVNKNTGEVSDECPWLAPDILSPVSTKVEIKDANDNNNDDEILGCGSLIYDGSEINQILDFLDSHKK